MPCRSAEPEGCKGVEREEREGPGSRISTGRLGRLSFKLSAVKRPATPEPMMAVVAGMRGMIGSIG